MTTRNETERRWWLAIFVGLGLALLTLQPYSVCPFAITTGLPCPGCGLSRSFVSLARGELSDAWRFHPLGPIIAAGGAALISLRTARRHLPSQVTTQRWWTANAYVWWAALVVVMAIWVARFCGAFGGPAEVHSPFELLQTLNRK